MHLDLPGHSGIIWMHPGCSQEPPRKRPESREHPGGTRETLTRDPETLRILISEATIQDPGPKMCVQMYVYLCTYIFLYVCICIHIYIYIYIFISFWICICMWILGAGPLNKDPGSWVREPGSKSMDPEPLTQDLWILVSGSRLQRKEVALGSHCNWLPSPTLQVKEVWKVKQAKQVEPVKRWCLRFAEYFSVFSWLSVAVLMPVATEHGCVSFRFSWLYCVWRTMYAN